MGAALAAPREVYDKLWRQTGALLKTNRIRVDPHLRDKASDSRRGVTLVGRPSAVVRRRIGEFLREVAAMYPRQHFYKLSELHVTVMAIISGSEFWREEIGRLPACQKVLNKVLKTSRPFRVHYRGVTVSPDAVMIQGFPTDDVLSRLRDAVRSAFGKAGLRGNLDRRYKTVTAHLTVMRFAQPETDWKRLLELLRAHRESDFGETRFQTLQLIRSNWYASADLVRVIQEYPLKN